MPVLFRSGLVESRASGTFCLYVADFTSDGASALDDGQRTTGECADIAGHRKKSLDRLISQT